MFLYLEGVQDASEVWHTVEGLVSKPEVAEIYDIHYAILLSGVVLQHVR